MKTIKISVLLSVLAITNLSGCSTLASNPWYAAWEERAYGAYGMSVPENAIMRAVMPYQPQDGALTYMPEQGYISNTIPVSDPVPPSEQQYIAEHYALQ